MKFYVIEDADGAVVGCQTSVGAARKVASLSGLDGCRIEEITVAVNAESIRLLLGQLGGYAKNTRTIFPRTDRS